MRIESQMDSYEWGQVLRAVRDPDLREKLIPLAHQTLAVECQSSLTDDGKVRGPRGVAWWEPTVGEWMMLGWSKVRPATVVTPSDALCRRLASELDERPIDDADRPRCRHTDAGVTVLPPLSVVRRELCEARSRVER